MNEDHVAGHGPTVHELEDQLDACTGRVRALEAQVAALSEERDELEAVIDAVRTEQRGLLDGTLLPEAVSWRALTAERLRSRPWGRAALRARVAAQRAGRRVRGVRGPADPDGMDTGDGSGS